MRRSRPAATLGPASSALGVLRAASLAAATAVRNRARSSRAPVISAADARELSHVALQGADDHPIEESGAAAEMASHALPA